MSVLPTSIPPQTGNGANGVNITETNFHGGVAIGGLGDTKEEAVDPYVKFTTSMVRVMDRKVT